MKSNIIRMSIIVSLGAAIDAQAQLNIPSDGSDGVFEPITNVVIDLGQAVTASWDTQNTANAGRGVYDPDKWAIVFKYRSIKIPSGVEVRFKNHPSRAPVVWLVKERVFLDGTVNLDGQNRGRDSAEFHINPEAGPGGFRGGARLLGEGAHLGPVGAALNPAFYASSYGNPQILPLIGGIGERADDRTSYGSSTGPAGGGAILIAAGDEIQVNGIVTCQGGLNLWNNRSSGGAIRCIANIIGGTGNLRANDRGRIRLEANSVALSQATEPETLAVPPGPTPIIWPPDDAPKARIVSVAGLNAPSDPTAPLNGTADLRIQSNSNVVITLETTNFPIEGAVKVRVAPKYAGAIELNAELMSGSFTQAMWRATTTFVPGYSTIQVRATAP